MTRQRRTTMEHVLGLVGLALALGCGESAEAPARATPPAAAVEGKTAPTDPAAPGVPEQPASALPREDPDPHGFELVSFDVEPLQVRAPVAVTAELKLTRDAEEHARVVLEAMCRIDGATYVDTEDQALVGKHGKRGATTAFDARFFGPRSDLDGHPLGDCDFWLGVRVLIPDTGGRHREHLLATRCLRDGEVLHEGCAAMPTAAAPKPLTPASVSLAIVRAEVVPEQGTESGYLLDFTVELTGNEAVAPRWDLDADVVCQGGGKTTHRREALQGVDVQDLGPGHKGRNSIARYAKPEETLDVPPEQCELAITGSQLAGDAVIELGTWCYLPDQPIRVGPCPTTGS